MKKSITLKDIAQHFKVSVSTVSKALKDSHDISVEMKKKIDDYAKAHNYRPNPYAVNLRKKENKTIGVIIPNILNYFFAQVFSGIEKVANEKGYNLISCISNESLAKERNTIEILEKGLVSGLLISLAEGTEKSNDHEHLISFAENGIPIVMFDRVTDDIECDKVIVDDYLGAYNAVEYLVKSGCKNIAVISPLDNLNIGKQRLKGYTEALKAHNLEVNPNLIVKIFDLELFTAEIRALLTRNKVDAILGLEEFSAINAMNIAVSLGHKIPDDISIIGFTNGQLPKHVSPKVTSISQHGKYIGELATKKLIERIEGKEDDKPEYVTHKLKTSLILRESTRSIPE
ncbi:LacI family DNA-binding transcriptional regulator [Galbibacter sp. EGI 63066]|uniref:LacI family DNA-binding transcriptional regulator n=1 Tax=Galbibacter sp. EGI 63066 TaxID=2993559 RepID=UPI0022487B0E|nr:LacI family DNA-binding transcriptional regulator [Galbibacter sp. EGI 63066]MCX2679156.1 LacI family DNA-binding transcriptional regulator [Galbibacter sp. EGI 63066]